MKTPFLEEGLAALEAAHLRRSPLEAEGPQGPELRVDGRTILNLCGNDYLGLASDPRLIAAAKAALETEGLGSGASRLVGGTRPAHRRLERALGGLMGSEAALLFNSGYHANLGTLPALVGPGDVVLSDALNHASIVDGCRLSRAEVRVYPHLDLTALEEGLRAARPARRRLVVTEAVFSMDGDLAPLRELCDLAEAYDALVMVDEAHALGVFGPRGAGLCEALGVQARVHARMGTLGKALGAFGAFVAGSGVLTEWLLQRARTFVFTTALPPAICAAAEAAVGLLASDPALLARLWRNIHHLRAGLEGLGLPVAGEASPILPVIVGDARRTMELSAALLARGVHAQGIRPPTVPEGTSRLRLTVSAAHTPEQLDRALEALSEVLTPAARRSIA